MASLHDTHRQDKEVTWLRVTPDIEIECSLLDTASPSYQSVFRKYTRPYKTLIAAKALPPKLDREIAVKVFVEVCVKNWRSVERDENGEQTGYRSEIEVKQGEWVAYSAENAVRVLTTYARLFKDVTDLAAELENYQLDDAEAKNSKRA